MAKKNEREIERRAVAEQLRKQQARKERTRSMRDHRRRRGHRHRPAAAALVPYIKDQREEPIGSTGARARRHRVGGRRASRSRPRRSIQDPGGRHLPRAEPARTVDYPDAPPAFGSHWPNFLPARRSAPSTPPRTVPRSSVWCTASSTATRSSGTTTASRRAREAYKQIQQIGDKLGRDSYFIAAPWTAERRQRLPQRQARRADPLDRPEGAEGRHAVLRQAQRPGDRGLPGEVPQDRRPGTGCHLTTADTGGRQVRSVRPLRRSWSTTALTSCAFWYDVTSSASPVSTTTTSSRPTTATVRPA